MYMENIKRFAKSEKELEIPIQTITIYSQDKGMEFYIEKCVLLMMMMMMMREKINNRRNRTTRSRKESER